eukprot:scaffold1938_cov399-Prasinococcus_capsulatus_cf.AAC.1
MSESWSIARRRVPSLHPSRAHWCLWRRLATHEAACGPPQTRHYRCTTRECVPSSRGGTRQPAAGWRPLPAPAQRLRGHTPPAPPWRRRKEAPGVLSAAPGTRRAYASAMAARGENAARSSPPFVLRTRVDCLAAARQRAMPAWPRHVAHGPRQNMSRGAQSAVDVMPTAATATPLAPEEPEPNQPQP